MRDLKTKLGFTGFDPQSASGEYLYSSRITTLHSYVCFKMMSLSGLGEDEEPTPDIC